MAQTERELFPEKVESQLRVYGYKIDDPAHEGLIKVGQTTQNVRSRIDQQLKTAGIKSQSV
jgi:hypothetical protein